MYANEEDVGGKAFVSSSASSLVASVCAVKVPALSAPSLVPPNAPPLSIPMHEYVAI